MQNKRAFLLNVVQRKVINKIGQVKASAAMTFHYGHNSCLQPVDNGSPCFTFEKKEPGLTVTTIIVTV